MVPPRVPEEDQPLIDEEAAIRLHGALEIPPSKQLRTVTGPTNCNMAVTWYWTATTGVLLFVGTVWYIVATSEWALFNWHPILMSLSVLSLTQGILLLQQTERKEERERGTNWHKWLQLTGFMTLLTGFAVIVTHKIMNDKEHFRSAHGKAGLILLISVFGQVAGGLSVLYAPGLYGGPAKAKAIYKYHRMGGYVGLVLTYLTALGGTQSGWATNQFDHVWVWLVAVLFVLIGTVLRINTRKMKVR